MTVFDQAYAFFQALCIVESQNTRRYFADFRQRFDRSFLQREMVAPTVCTRIEKAYQLFGRPIDRTEVAAFVAIAALTGLREVVRFSWAIVFDADEVVYLTAEKRVVEINQAIFTEFFGASENELSEGFADVLAHGFISLRARIFAIRITCSSHM